jgi:hypothetical protein
MTLYDSARYLHILAGTIALLLFWTAAFLRKGKQPHRLVGRGYLIAMVSIMLTAVPLAMGAFQRGKPVQGTFLLYLIVITASAAWLAWRAIREKHHFERYTGAIYRTLAWGNLISGAIVLATGLRFDAFLLTGFSFVGLITGAFMLRFTARSPGERTWWLKEHYGAIVGCGIATHVAFLSLGLQRLLPPEWNGATLQFAFFAPLLVGLSARVWLDRKYGGKRRGRAGKVNYATSVTPNSDDGRLMCSSFDSSPAASAKANARTACSIAPTQISNPAAPSPSSGAAARVNPRY